MHLRRTGLLLPLAQALLALLVGCSHQSTEPNNEISGEFSEIEADKLSTGSPARATAQLQHVDSVPHLQQAPLTANPTDAASEIVQARYRPASTEIGGPGKVEFGRAPDYTWLQGELLFSSVRGVWRLRYAAADDEDPYGGSVTLVHVDANLCLQAGQHIRVRGKLINPRTTEPSPYYHVVQVEETK